MSVPFEVYGALGSPYSMKVRAALRAKRLPHTWTGMTAEDRQRVMANVKAPVIPVVRKPDGTWANDSTPLLLSLEGQGRSLLPDDPLARFACMLLEDMADEWFMKAMFHYRWAYSKDAKWVANWLIYDTLPRAGKQGVETAANDIRQRQIERMPLVGCTPQTGPLIEASWKRCCEHLEAMALSGQRFLFGNRISLADLAYYGQLKVMSTDPTPMAWLRDYTPYLYRWLDHADDASGVDGIWTATGLSEPVQGLLKVAGDTYLPFLTANEAAISAGEETFSLQVEGGRYSQNTFKYQVKCLHDLRAHWAQLDSFQKTAIRAHIGKGADVLER
jgi:glutathione S-transferase